MTLGIDIVHPNRIIENAGDAFWPIAIAVLAIFAVLGMLWWSAREK